MDNEIDEIVKKIYTHFGLDISRIRIIKGCKKEYTIRAMTKMYLHCERGYSISVISKYFLKSRRNTFRLISNFKTWVFMYKDLSSMYEDIISLFEEDKKENPSE